MTKKLKGSATTMEPKNAMAEPDILGPARKAELFEELLKVFEEFMEDEDVYEILRSMMTDQEIIKSGFHFKHNDAEQQALAVLEQLGGQAEPGIPANTAKLRDLLAIRLPDEAYLEHRSAGVDLLSIGDIDTEDITPDKLAGWKDILNADIVRIFPGAYGVHIEVDNVDPERLSDFVVLASLSKLAEPQEELEDHLEELSL